MKEPSNFDCVVIVKAEKGYGLIYIVSDSQNGLGTITFVRLKVFLSVLK